MMDGEPKWANPREVSFRTVPDPSMTDAEYFHQRQSRSGPDVGKVVAAVSMIELIGGLARIRNRSEAQEAAAAKYRLLYERAQIGGARAIDYAAVKVDTSGPMVSASSDIGEDARREYKDAVRHIGMMRSNLVERVVVNDLAISAIAGNGSRARARMTRLLLDTLDDLAVHFKLAAKRVA